MDKRTIAEQLLPEKSIKREITRRRNPLEYQTVNKRLRPEYEAEGWEIQRENKTTLRMFRPKPHHRAFEDQVWAVLAGLGFRQLNSDRTFKIFYGESDGESKQIDVFAADDETVLVVECKSTTTPQGSGFGVAPLRETPEAGRMVFQARSPEWAQRDIQRSSVARRSSCGGRLIDRVVR